MPVRRVKPDVGHGVLVGVNQLSPDVGAFARKVPDSPVLDGQQTGGFRSDPEIGLIVFKQIDNAVAGQAGRVVFVENGELNSVKPHQTVERSKPETAVVRLDDGDDFAVRQAVFRAP